MKRLFVALVIMMSSSAFAAVAPDLMDLNESDSKQMYMALSKWGVRYVDQEKGLIRIDVGDILCRGGYHDQQPEGCRLLNLNNDRVELVRTDKAAMWLTKLLIKHVGSRCEDPNNQNTYCLTAARLIRCWHPYDPKNPPTLFPVGRRHICWIEPIRN